MSFDVRTASADLAAQGVVNMYAWRDQDGNMVDSQVAFPGEPVEDDGNAARQSRNTGRQVVFAGIVPMAELMKLKVEGELQNGRS